MPGPGPYASWPSEEYARWIRAGNTFGRHLMAAARDYAFRRIAKDTPPAQRQLALLKIAHIYGAEVVAEGVETIMQRDTLRTAGCGFAQGFLFAKPMDGRFFGAYALTHLVEGGDVA